MNSERQIMNNEVGNTHLQPPSPPLLKFINFFSPPMQPFLPNLYLLI